MSSYGTYVIDDSAWPLVYFGTHGSITDDQYRAALRHLEQSCGGGRGKYALLVNGHQGAFIGGTQRKITLEMMRRTAAAASQNCFGVAVVLASKLQQKALNGFLFFAPTKFPLTIKTTYADAGAWLSDKAQGAGLDLSVAQTRSSLMMYVKSIDPIHLED